MRILMLLTLVGTLAACGGEDQTASTPASWSASAGLTYAYPYDGQNQVAAGAPVVLHFSAPVQSASGDALADSFSLRDAEGNPVSFSLTQTDGGRGVVLSPTGLAENQHYHVTWSNLAAADGQIAPRTLNFSTRPARKGMKNLISTAADFQVERMLPIQSGLPFMDFSTLRLQFTQPLDTKTLNYGQTLRLEDADGNLVPATVLTSAQLLSIDPKSDLTPGKTYHLKLTNGLKSVLGNALSTGDYADLALVPKNSAPRTTMAMEVPDSSNGSVLSPLTGAAINYVPIASKLLGKNSASQQSGNLYAELAYVPNYPNASPITMRRGNLLTGSAVDVKIVGQVPAGLNTGAVRVNIISDATGYMAPNPYSKAVDAPRLVYLTMDAAMSAENTSANGALNQNILHIETVGTAIVKNGRLVMDAVGVVELDVLGLDQATGVLSFHLEGYADQTKAPAQPRDTTAPTLQSWVPGSEGKRARPGDPVILTFSEPLDPNSVSSSSLKLLKNGVAEAMDWRLDGSSLVIRPQSPLAHNADYTVQFTDTITDLAGNGVADDSHSRNFALPPLSNAGSHAPVVLATFPGFPCATTGRDPDAGVQGRCSGGKTSDDLMPIPTLPADRSIQVRFSQTMASASIQLGNACDAGSVRVELLDSSGNCQGVVSGRLDVGAQSLRFTPDSPWIDGQLYRYVLNSNGNSQSATASCDGSQALCGSNGLPLQTQLVAQSASSAPSATGGGPALEIWFRGTAPATSVGQRLRGLPASDMNANFVHDSGEDGPVNTNGVYLAPNAARVITTGQGGLLQGSNVGCDVGTSCPENQFAYASTALDAEVADYDADTDAVRVFIQPSLIMASSIDIYADAGLAGKTMAPTGPLILRLRYAVNPATGRREVPITGYLRYVDGALHMTATLDVYLDTPSLQPKLGTLTIGHNLHSFALNGITISGPVSFLPDGRMQVSLSNESNINFTVVFTPNVGTIDMRLPQGTTKLDGVAQPIKP